MKIIVFGDSISEGIGKKKVNYCNFLSEELREKYKEVEIVNLAHTGTTIRYMKELLNNVSENIEIAVIGYGNVDAMLRPNPDHRPNYYHYLPSRYKQNGMLNPRPYYSSKWYKSILQHADSLLRWNLNKLLLCLQGETTWVSEKEFQVLYEECVRKLLSKEAKIIALSTVQLKDQYFPGTNQKYIRFNKIIKEICKSHSCKYIDLYHSLEEQSYFYEDGFHPNELGYRRIAEIIGNTIKEQLSDGI